jgi:integrase
MAAVLAREALRLNIVEKSGRLEAKYYDIRGERIVRMFPGQAALDAHLWFEFRMGRLPGSKPPTLFKDVAEEYCIFICKIENVGREGRAANVRRHIIPHFAGYYLPEVTGAALSGFRDLLYARVSDKYAARIIASLVSLFDRAIKNREMEAKDNPFLELRPRLETSTSLIEARDKRRRRAALPLPTREQIDCMVAAAEGPVLLIVMLAAFAGLRGQEIRALQWRHVLLGLQKLNIEQAIKYKTKDPGVPKTNAGDRMVGIDGPLLQLLETLHPGEDFDDEYVVQIDGQPLTYLALYHAVHQLQVSVGIGQSTMGPNGYRVYEGTFGPHMLRHLCVALWIWERKKSQRRIIKEIGHKNVGTTYGIYGSLFTAMVENAPTWPTSGPPTSTSTEEQIAFECETWL